MNSDLSPCKVTSPQNLVAWGGYVRFLALAYITLALFPYHAYLLWRGGPAYMLTQLGLGLGVVTVGVCYILGRRWGRYGALHASALCVLILAQTLLFTSTRLPAYLGDLGAERRVRTFFTLDGLQNGARRRSTNRPASYKFGSNMAITVIWTHRSFPGEASRCLSPPTS